MLTDNHVHADDEAGVEINENISVDIQNGGCVLEENGGKTVADYK